LGLAVVEVVEKLSGIGHGSGKIASVRRGHHPEATLAQR
jgi:hypothetical protein